MTRRSPSRVHDAHRHLGVLPAHPFYGGPPVNPDTTARETIDDLLADLDREGIERTLVLPNYGVPDPSTSFALNDLVIEAAQRDDRILAGLWTSPRPPPPPRRHGGVVHTLALAEALARADAEVTVWSLGRGGDAAFFRPVDPAVSVRLVPFPDVPDEDVGERILRSIAVLGAAFAACGERYDVVHAQDCISANAAPDCVRTVHHLDTFTTPALAACHDRAVVRPHALVCVSAAVATEVERGWERTPGVIPNGVDADRFAAAAGPGEAPARARWRQRLGRYVLAVGGIEPRKGTLDLVEAMALVHRERPDLALAIAGGETLFDYRDYRIRVEHRAAALGVTPVVLGPVPHPDLPTLVAAADVLAFPSTKEGFGLAAMEALAAGVPVVTRDLPVLRDGAAAFATDPPGLAAALLAAARSPDPARRAAGRRLAGRHSWDAAAAAHLAFYTCLRRPGGTQGFTGA